MNEPIRAGINPETAMTGNLPGGTPVDEEDISPMSILDELREELAQDVQIENMYVVVPNRPTIKLIFRPSFDLDDLKRWRTSSREKKHKQDSEINQKKFFYLVLAETCIGLQMFSKKRQVWVDVNDLKTGMPWTLKTPALTEYLKLAAGGWYANVEKMYSNDGHVVMTANAIMDEAGFGNYDIEAGEEGPLDS